MITLLIRCAMLRYLPLGRGFLVLLGLGALTLPLWGQQPGEVRIGVVFDGPSDENARWRILFEEEIRALLGDEFSVAFPREKQLEADWSSAGIDDALDALLADPEVDYVLTLGILSSNQIAQRGPLPKPVFAPFVLNTTVQSIPSAFLPDPASGTLVAVSGVDNLSYVESGVDPVAEINTFREIADFTRLTVLAMEGLGDIFPNLEATLAPFGLDMTGLEVGDNLQTALEAIPPDTEAVYVTPLLRLSAAEFGQLVDALIERRLPSFSLRGRSEVREGILASLAGEEYPVRRARRVALNIQQVLLGTPAAELPVAFDREERITINMDTAAAIGVSPRFTTLIEADLLAGEVLQSAEPLSLSGVVRESSIVNLDLAVADRRVTAGSNRVGRARAPLLPNVDLVGSANLIDDDRASLSFGQRGQGQIRGSLGFSQLVYSDDVWASYDIERYLQDLRVEERAELRLDVILEAAESYLNLLRGKTIERIEVDNLELTRTNLGLARARVDIGAAGPEEVFRWESQLATDQQAVIDASALTGIAEIALRRVLNRPLDQPIETMEPDLDDAELISSFEQLAGYVDNPAGLEAFQAFVTGEAFESAPELRQLDAAVLAAERAFEASGRAFYIPEVVVGAEVAGVGNSTSDVALPSLPGLVDLDDLEWTVGLGVRLPLFEGGDLRARRGEAREELAQARLQRDTTRQRVEQRVRSAALETSSTYVGIELARNASEAARRNLDLVREGYAEGIADVIVLIDAQNQALVADLIAANAVFDYLMELMGLQRAVGRFDYYRSPEDQQAFLSRLDTFFDERGVTVRAN